MIDPTREDIETFLGQHVTAYEADKFDTESAIYWFTYKYHGGQSSNLYEVLSESPYSPGACERDVEPDSVASILHDLLVDEYC